MINIALAQAAAEGFPLGGSMPEMSLIDQTPVLTSYAQAMVDHANRYLSEMAILAKEPDPVEEEDTSKETVATEGEDPAHHNGNPVGYENGEA